MFGISVSDSDVHMHELRAFSMLVWSRRKMENRTRTCSNPHYGTRPLVNKICFLSHYTWGKVLFTISPVQILSVQICIFFLGRGCILDLWEERKGCGTDDATFRIKSPPQIQDETALMERLFYQMQLENIFKWRRTNYEEVVFLLL